MKRYFLPVLFLFLSLIDLPAQSYFTVSVFNNAVALPGGSFSGPLHPGIDAGWIKPLQEGTHSETFLTFKLGYYYQRVAHQGLQAYGEYHYRYYFTKSLAAGISGGLGYLHTLELHDIFEQNASGKYERVGRWGKMHAQFSGALNVSYGTSKRPVRPFVEYRFRLMTPFVKQYIPVLPSTSLHVGTFFTLSSQPQY